MNRFFSSLKNRLRGTAPHRLPDRVTANPQWQGLPEAAIERIAGRIRRLHAAFSSRYRMDGNLTIPILRRVHGDRIYTSAPQPRRAALSLRQAHRTLTMPQKLLLIRSLLAQIEQLQQLGFVHGAICESQVVLFRHAGRCIGSILAPEHGRFTDEPVNDENRFESPCMSPEMMRCIHYPAADAQPDDDIFSCGCLFHLLLKGTYPGPKGLHAAEALASAVPIAPAGSDALSWLLRRMLAPDPTQRPSAAQLLAAMRDEALGAASQPHIFPEETDSHWQQIRILHRLPSTGDTDLLQAYRQYCERQLSRIAAICRRSLHWHALCESIAPNRLLRTSGDIRTGIPLPGTALPLAQYHRLETSLFLRDARFVDILYAVQVLHDDGYILGIVTPDLFCIGIDGPLARSCLLDLSGALLLEALPPPQDICPDAQSALLLAPEIAQYICSPDAGSASDAREWIGPGSDIFSLGLIFHLLLTGTLPRLTDPVQPTYACAVAGDASGTAIALSERLDEPHRHLIAQMLAMDPLDRPARCDAIADAILDLYTG